MKPHRTRFLAIPAVAAAAAMVLAACSSSGGSSNASGGNSQVADPHRDVTVADR